MRHFTCAVGELALMLQATATALPSLIFHVGTVNLPPAFVHVFDCFLAKNVSWWVGRMLILLVDNLIILLTSDCQVLAVY